MGISPEYVLDQMEFYEMSCLMEHMWMKNKESWEQTRTMAYITAQVNSTKNISPDDLMTFPWEKKVEVEMDSKEDIQKMMEEIKIYENKMNNGK